MTKGENHINKFVVVKKKNNAACSVALEHKNTCCRLRVLL